MLAPVAQPTLRARRPTPALRGLVVLAATMGGLSPAATAGAQPFRFHATAAAAHALGGHQQEELSIGAGLSGVVEYALAEQLAAGLKLGGAWLSEGDPPGDPSIVPEGDATVYGAALGITTYPLASGDEGSSLSAAGLWLSAAGGVASTGGRLRATVDAFAGWDLYHPEPNLGIGPTLGVLHVFQPDDHLRPDDANLFMFGIHARFWFKPKSPAEPKPKAEVERDRDGDGLLDSVDRCPEEPEDRDGFQDEDGCPDLDDDGDGIVDRSDKCPREPEDKDEFEDEDGCPELDNDNDEIPDAKDKCRDEPEDHDDFEDEDGCPDPDNDQDAIPDTEDLCPNEPENVNGYADNDGCPDEDQVRVVGSKIVLDERVHFRTNSAIITPGSYPLLERLAKLIREHPEYTHISIEGHADDRGPESFNQKISADRARAVLEFLVKHGVERERLSSKGFGSTRPLVDKRSPRAYFMNRRVEFVVTREVREAQRAEGGESEAGDAGQSGSGGDRTDTTGAAPKPAGEPPGGAGDSAPATDDEVKP